MSQEAYTKFVPELKDGGLLIIEQDLVRVSEIKAGTRLFSIPATRLAEELGKRMVLNIVMVGFFAAVANIVKPESLREAVAASVPSAFKELNLKAFDKGYEYGVSKLKVTPGGEELALAAVAGVLEAN
jgi:2-oxoglutarate ferredoxin oxidoreductase subunit gamma